MSEILSSQILSYQECTWSFALTATRSIGESHRPLRICTHLELIQSVLLTYRFSDEHEFTKPNDERALRLMDHAARAVMEAHPDIMLAFGESDEYR